MLSTLDQSFTGFRPALSEFVFDLAKEETSKLSKQPLPSSLEMADLEKFTYEQYYDELWADAPVLHAAVSGAMATNVEYSEMQVHGTG
jgi:hypothetical protein